MELGEPIHVGKVNLDNLLFYTIHKNQFQMGCKSKCEIYNRNLWNNIWESVYKFGVGKFMFKQSTRKDWLVGPH